MILKGTVYSKILEMDTGISIVTPNKFIPDGDYKVAYLLHGVAGNCSTWTDYSMLPAYAYSGKTIYIMPDAARSFYVDMRHGFKYFTYITEELPSICKSVFNISSARENTAILGGSMGGYGALKCALAKPEQYGMCGAFSSACLFIKEGLKEQKQKGNIKDMLEKFGERLSADILAAYGEELEVKPKDDILELATAISDMEVKPIIYSACGTGDFLLEENKKFYNEMKKLNFDYTYEEFEGKHDFIFFSEALRRAIEKLGL